MCNAWNHSFDCDCGWGGAGHKGSSPGWTGSSYTPASRHAFFYTNVFDTYYSYIDPNARCPVCDAPVFFYQSPYGGRVFFDELGPPWPKHPCTDTNANVVTLLSPREQASFRPDDPSFSNQSVEKTTQYMWQQNGWLPFLASPIAHSGECIKFQGTVANTSTRLVLYAPRRAFFSSALPLLVRYEDGRYKLASFRYEQHLQKVLPIEVIAENLPPGMQSWLGHTTLEQLVLWFLSRGKLPIRSFDLRDKNRFGTSRWISDPPRFYTSIRQVIEKGREGTSEEEQATLLKDLKALERLFGKKS